MTFASATRRVAVSVAIAFAGFAVAPAARADAESDAKDLFVRGRELRSKNDCTAAVPLFRKAYEIWPEGLGSLRNVAECEEQLQHWAAARRAWLEIKRQLLVPPALNNAKYEGWDKDAEEANVRLKPRVASVVVDVTIKSDDGEQPATSQSGVEIFVNGESIGMKLVGLPLERDPGPSKIKAKLGDAVVEQQVTLAPGENPHVKLRLVVKGAPKPPPGDNGAVAVDSSAATKRTIGWIVTGVGGAVLIGGGVTFLLRQGAVSDVEDKCPTKTNCDPSLKDTVDKGKTMSTLTTVLVPVGAVGVAAGLFLVLTSKDAPSQKTGIRVTPSLGGIDVTGRF